MMVRSGKLYAPVVLLALLSGCGKKEQSAPPKLDTAQSHMVKKETLLVVPDFVKGKWKSVKIAVLDKSVARESVYSVPIGGKTTLPGSSMTIEVDVFLPAFVMEGSTMTSSSNELKNPGVKVRITEKGSIVFAGWLFTLFPNTHAFMHPRYAFTLVDVVPATK